ncbi:hypothetical protein C5Y96_15885 [Blastopirellula marina]|uniref:ResB-like domain-containing protein n=1 Tax=Blastopirellula marina TaxID=124 RepID=A0A2S8FAN8_9BACT|nr:MULTISPECIES: hypothetical protein [Pirellulaceae]PQO29225.1 hypothetical protein C5Y96_15885 [Blastopirellula marina]RCS50418.1 hypothetical protein DTL36_15905 [Bremerella cremea]
MRSPTPNYFSFCLIAVLGCLLVASQPARAQSDTSLPPEPEAAGYWVAKEHDLQVLTPELGIAGHFKLGSWTEVRFSVRSEEFINSVPKVSIIALDSDGVPTEIMAPKSNQAGDLFFYRVPAKIGRRDSNLKIKFITEEGGSVKTSIREIPVSQLAKPVAASNRLFLQIGPDIGLGEALNRYASDLSDSTTFVTLPSPYQIPSQWYMLEGIDHIVWSANDPAQISAMQPEQLAAIEKWLKLGGKMTLSVGDKAADLIGLGKPLASFCPGTFREVQQLRNTTELEALINTVAHVDRPVEKPLPIAVMQSPSGIIVVQEGSRQASTPLWIRSANGFGVVEFFAFDLSANPIANWPGREPLLKLLLDGISDRLDESKVSMQSGSSVAHFGYTDIAGQLRLALDQFPGVRSVSFFLIGFIIIAYLALIGPGDYFFLRKVGLRMEWTWVTFPAMILLASVGIWSLATWWKGTSLKMNHVEVVDIDLESQLVRSTTWFHLFSPESQRYEVNLQPVTVPSNNWNQLVSWQGLAGSGLGGMSARQSISTVPTPYAINFALKDDTTQASLQELPIQIWSSKTLMGRGWGPLSKTEYEPLNERESQLIEGVLTNPTDMELTDCYVFHGRWAYFVAKLPANGSARIVPGQSAQNTEKVLKRRRVQESTDGGELWDRQSTDVQRIMEITMFHSAAGGRSYSSLSNRFQSYVDLSSHITGDRAVLVGKVANPPSKIQVDGQPVDDTQTQSWSYVRIIYPVQKRSPSEIAQK